MLCDCFISSHAVLTVWFAKGTVSSSSRFPFAVPLGLGGHYLRFDELFEHQFRNWGVEMRHFGGSPLQEEPTLLQILGDQRRALIGIFGSNVLGNCSALVEDKPIVILDVFGLGRASTMSEGT